ncbi:hypothetical protein LSH36_463g06036 [Paralvinella palmiformis]|uniref:G-protein coupled receptors family 1 profile domain-containing protein n=1 Tax=Paralvinella palmiformis TaxID=53620 RepID=A0AAD9MZY1_9ANNE|nr:hypothetical protein LSH36_463g06036 [Paralvinella palmiformis]
MEFGSYNQSDNATNTSARAIIGDDVDDDEVSPAIIHFITIFMSIASATGTGGNLLVLIMLILQKKLYQNNLMNIYIGNLAISDLIICVLLIPYHLFTIRSKTGLLGCKAMGFLSILLLYVSIISLAAIALNRYALFTWPRDRYKYCYTHRRINYSIVIIWLLCFVLCCPLVLGFGRTGYNRKLGSCFFPSDDLLSYIYIMTIGHAIIAFPALGFTSFVYIRIMLIYKRMRCHLDTHSNPVISISSTGNKPTTCTTSSVIAEVGSILQTNSECYSLDLLNESGAGEGGRKHCQKIKRTRMTVEWLTISMGGNSVIMQRFQKKMFIILALFIIWLAFVICWMPLLLVYSVDYYKLIPANYYQVALALAFANSAINPLLYGMLNRDFRKAFIFMLKCPKSDSQWDE